MAQKWQKEHLEILIESYEREPCLYVVTNKNYHNRHLREQSLKRIAAALEFVRPGTTSSDITKKMHSLRNNFFAEHKKVKNSTKSGCGTDDIYVPSLWYYEKMKFLEQFHSSRDSVTVGLNSKAALLATNTSESIEDVVSDRSSIQRLEDIVTIRNIDTTVSKDCSVNVTDLTISDITDVDVTVEEATIDHDYTIMTTFPKPQFTSTQFTDTIPPSPVNDDVPISRSSTPVCATPSTSSTSSKRRMSVHSDSASEAATSSKRRRTSARSDSASETATSLAMDELIKKLNAPIVVPNIAPPSSSAKDLVGSFLDTIGAIIRRIPDELQQEELLRDILVFVTDRRRMLHSSRE